MHTAIPEVSRIKIIPPFRKQCDFLVINEEITDFEIDLSGAHMTASDLLHKELDNEFRIRALITAVNLIKEFKNQVEELEAAYSIFEPIFKLLKGNKFEKYPLNVRKHTKELRKEIKTLRNKKLKHIVRQKKRPKPLRLYEPKIVTVYVKFVYNLEKNILYNMFYRTQKHNTHINDY